jgi:hypothetical protein
VASTIGSAAGGVNALPPNSALIIKEACDENVQGFEHAYTVTFYAAFAALALGLMLPGWPFKWAGRRAADQPQVVGGH